MAKTTANTQNSSSAGQFAFEISLSVLNHLGRSLYRSFATVLGEAISNSWDADAKKVEIFVQRDQNSFFIKDDGVGMTAFNGSTGMGLQIMDFRARMIGGSLQVQRRDVTGGTIVACSFPLTNGARG